MKYPYSTLGHFDRDDRNIKPLCCEIANTHEQLDALRIRSPEISNKSSENIVEQVNITVSPALIM